VERGQYWMVAARLRIRTEGSKLGQHPFGTQKLTDPILTRINMAAHIPTARTVPASRIGDQRSF
jgi:hypothetical protein